MDLYNNDNVTIARRIKAEPLGILETARNLGLFSPKSSDIVDSAIFSKRVHALWPRFSNSKDGIRYINSVKVTRIESMSDITISIIDDLDLSLNLHQTSLLEQINQITIITLKETGETFDFHTEPYIQQRKDKNPLVIPTVILDRIIDDIIPFNGTNHLFMDDIKIDFEKLKSDIICNWDEKNWSSDKRKTRCLYVTTKSDGITKQWRIKRSYLRKMAGVHFISLNTDFVF